MLKKLQNLLFEDDDDDELEDEDEVEEEKEPVTTHQVHTVSEQPKTVSVQPQAEETVKKEEQSHMNRIDLTGFVPVQEARPEQTSSVQTAPVREEKKTAKLGITVDDLDDVAATRKNVQQVKPKVQKHVKTQAKKAVSKPVSKPSYQFQPVISPIFGVDEKDLTALKTTTQKVAEINSQNDDDSNITPVISPIYGSTSEGTSSAFDQPVVKETVTKKEAPVQKQEEPKATAPVEDEIPEFSLDDILKVRDEEYDNGSDDLSNTAPLFPDLDLQFPDDPEDDETANNTSTKAGK